MILTSHEQMDDTDNKTGLWLGEYTDPWYVFLDAGFQVTLSSPKGGKPPIDPLSLLTENITASNRRFNEDTQAKAALNTTHRLEEINPDDFDAVFYPGGHGPLWDLADNEKSGRLILDFYDKLKPIAAVCHGPAAFLKAEQLQPGLLKGKRMTGFTNLEETLVLRSNNIPYKLETGLEEAGVVFHSAVLPYTQHTEQDGLFITGQNPASASAVAMRLVKLLKGNGIGDV